MTPEQQARYERDRAAAEAEYNRLMMESNAAVIRAKAPTTPQTAPSFWSRVCAAMICARSAP